MQVGVRSLAAFIPEEKVTAADYAHLAAVMPEWLTPPSEKRRFLILTHPRSWRCRSPGMR